MPTPTPRHLEPQAPKPDVPAQVDEVIATGMAKDPNNRYATTIELADAARDAITVPVQRPTPAPTLLPPTRQAPGHKPAQPMTVKAASPDPVKPAPPPHSAPPVPTRAGGISRSTIALIAGAVALVAVIAAVIGISALGKNRPSEPSPTSSSPPTSSERSYGAQIVLPFNGLKYPGNVAVDRSATSTSSIWATGGC